MDDIIGRPASDTRKLIIDDDVEVDPSSFTFVPPEADEGERDVNEAFGDIDLLINPQQTTKPTTYSDKDDDSEHNGENNNYFTSNRLFGGEVPLEDPVPNPTYSFPAADNASVSSRASDHYQAPAQSYEEIQKEKQKLLFEIERYRRRGMKTSRNFTMASNIDDIRFEHKRMKHERDLDASVKFQRRVLLAIVSGAEWANTTFDPIGAKLDGWSENVMGELDNYDEIFEELHDKYAEKVKMAPELRLMMMLGGSAFMFHMSNSFFKGGFDINEVMRENPDLLRNLAQASMKHGAQAHGIPPNDPTFQMMQQGINMHTGHADDIINELNGVGSAPVDPPRSKPKRRRRAKNTSSFDLDL